MSLALALWVTVAAATPIAFEDVSEAMDMEIRSWEFGGDGIQGLAWFDFDGDLDLDLFVGNGPTQPCALFRNDNGQFIDIAAEAGVAVTTGVSGVLAADLDNDGDADLILSGDGGVLQDARAPMRTFENNGDGTFADRTETAGIVGRTNNLGATAGDFDGDGLLDLFVSAPGSLFTLINDRSTLYSNNGDFTFTDVSAGSGVDTDWGSCVATFTHLDGDNAIDLLVGNCNRADGSAAPFETFLNRGDGTFIDESERLGITAQGYWMGFAFADFDGDQTMDFFSTNVDVHVLYRRVTPDLWADYSAATGVRNGKFAWGTVSPDFDNDGWPDLYYVGALPMIDRQIGDKASAGEVYRNRGDGSFEAPTLPVDFSCRFASGVAQADYDGDGFPDLAITSSELVNVAGLGCGTQIEGGVTLLRNVGNDSHWLTVRLQPTTGNRDAVGALIYATTESGTQMRAIHRGSSFASTNTPWPTFGLADSDRADICVRWSAGDSECFGTIEANVQIELEEGQGVAEIEVDRPGPGPDRAERSSRSGGCAHLPLGGGWWVLLAFAAIRRGSGR